MSKRIPALRIPNTVFIIAKFFGSGVIIATAFIHVPPLLCLIKVIKLTEILDVTQCI